MIKINLQMFGGGGGGSGGTRTTNTGKEKTVKLGTYITSTREVKPDKTYILFNAMDDKKFEVPGTYLSGQIENKKLWYDRDLGVWVSAKGNKYDIRKRKK